MTYPPRSLVDPHGRTISYLRLSVTDRCNFRCVYCMAENMTFLPKKNLLSYEEILTICNSFIELGVTKIRLTGGEPLVRKDIVSLCEKLANEDRLEELAMTTNGARLKELARPLKEAGLVRLNISLDTLSPKKFRKITRTGDINDVFAGIEAAQEAGFEYTKINAVIMRNYNEVEILALLEFAMANGLDITFIEEMPLGHVTQNDRDRSYYSTQQVRQQIEKRYTLSPLEISTLGPSRYYKTPGHTSRIGFISPHSQNFCAACNRLRLTAEGQLLMCLGNEHAVDLKTFIRAHPGDRDALKDLMQRSLQLKPKEHHFKSDGQVEIARFMNMTGG